MGTHLRYSLITADLSCNIIKHPQIVMKELGITYKHSTPQSMGDQWWFWNCENIPDELPEFLSILDIGDPTEYIGFGLNGEEVNKINSYKSI